MTEGYKIRNDFTGRADVSFQIGVNNGPISMTSPPNPPSLDGKQAELLQKLADEVSSASGRELSKWGIRDRDALPVRWHTAAEDLFDYWEKIQADGVPVPLAGNFTSIRQTYEAIESRRLVILGRAGAGKTVLAHRLILDLLKSRITGPVPVLFSLGGWDPATDLRCWMAEHLARDYPFLAAKETTTDRYVADLFLERGLIVPLLDGFDEILKDRHPEAVRGISTLDLPLIVSSRLDEYVHAAHEIKAVGGAAAIELEDLSLDEAHEYLLHSTGKTRAHAWNSMFGQLRTASDQPASKNLTAVLTTPLMVMLVRTVYNDGRGHDPAELLNSAQFPSVKALEDHLLAAYLGTVYAPGGAGSNRARRPEWRSDQVHRWLGYLATHLQDRNTHDIAWWRLPDTFHHLTRRFVTITTVWLALGVPAWILFGGLWGLSQLPHGLAFGLIYGFKKGALFGLLFGSIFGIVAGVFSEAGFNYRNAKINESPRLWVPPQGPQSRLRLVHLKKFKTQSAVGLGIAFLCIIGGGIERGTYGLAVGLLFGLAALSGVFALSDFGDTSISHVSYPWTLLALDRRVTLVRTSATIPTFTLAFMCILMLGPGFDRGDAAVVGIGTGIFAGALVGVVRFSLSAWGQWLMFARLWLPLTRRLPWRPKRFFEDAYDRGVLRRTGAVYQFRHAQLRDHLAEQYRS